MAPLQEAPQVHREAHQEVPQVPVVLVLVALARADPAAEEEVAVAALREAGRNFHITEISAIKPFGLV